MDIGDLVDGRYQLLALLGSGGMADVYEVEHRALGRRFALKVLRAELARDAAVRARFEREARAVARLSSDHIVSILDCGQSEQGAPFFVMERLHGRELRRVLDEEGALPLQRALHVALDVCRALSVAHGAGVIHRDLKPENLFLVQDGDGRDHCKVLDFGVAKLAGENPTLPGTLMGTARYMAPEQIGTASAVGPATDVFALGVILFECLAGEPPFNADTLERVLYKIVNEAPPSLLELRPELPRPLARLLERMLAKAPAERPQTARELLDALSTFTFAARSGLASAATEATLLETTPPRGEDALQAPARRTSRWGMLATFALGVGLGLLLGFVSRSKPTEPTAEKVADTQPLTAPIPASAAAIPSPPPAETASAETTASVVKSATPPTPSLPVSARASRASATTSAPTAPTTPSKPPLFYPQELHP